MSDNAPEQLNDSTPTNETSTGKTKMHSRVVQVISVGALGLLLVLVWYFLSSKTKQSCR